MAARRSPEEGKSEGGLSTLSRAWRDSYFLRKSAQLSVAWLGLAILSAQTGPWSISDLLVLAVLLGIGLWR